MYCTKFMYLVQKYFFPDVTYRHISCSLIVDTQYQLELYRWGLQVNSRVVTMGVMFLPALSQKCSAIAQKLPTRPNPLPKEDAMLGLVGVKCLKCPDRI